MAYNGYLLKLGEYIFPMKYIKPSTYSPYLNMQDIDDYTDANGYLHRNTVELKVAKVEFETVPMLTDSELSEIMQNIESQFVNSNKKELYFTLYIPTKNEYVTQYGYLVDIKPTIYGTYNNKVKYNSIRFAIVGGVYGG